MKKSYRNYYAELDNGNIIRVPNQAKSEDEYISIYGLSAVLNRAKRTRAYKKANQFADARIRKIILPSGEEVTQF